MSVLTWRAERALLGAMLREPAQTAALDYVENADFAALEHRIVHQAIITAAKSWNGGTSWHQAVQATAGPYIPPGYLDEMEAACPDPLHGRAYAALVLTAHAHRALLKSADDHAGQSKRLANDADRLIRAGADDGGHVSSLAQHTGRVGEALRKWAAHSHPDTTSPPTRALAGAADTRGQQEELVLGALIGQHRETSELLSLLVPEAFSDPLRQHVFEAVRVLHASGRDIDPLTADWELAFLPSAQAGGLAGTAGGGPSYVTRLATAAAHAGRLAQTAYDLVHQRTGRPDSRRHAAGGAVPGIAAPEASPHTPTPLLRPPPALRADGHLPGQRM